MPVIEIEAPDGSIVEFPEGTDDATIERAMRQAYGGPDSAAGAGVPTLGEPVPAQPALRHPDGRLTEAGWAAEIEATKARRQQQIDDQSFFENAVAGFGRAAPQLGQGVKQYATETLGDVVSGVNTVSDALGLPDPSGIRATLGEGFDNAIAEQQRETALERAGSRDLMSTGGGILGNLAGDFVLTAPLAPAGVAARGAGIGRAVGQAALGGAAQGAIQPVAEEGERGRNMTLGAAIGGGLAGVGRGVMRAAEEVLPSNVVSRALNYFGEKANRSTFAQEGEALAQRTGIDLSPGAVSGSRTQTAAENMTRQSLFTAEKAFKADERVAEQAIGHIQRTMDRISPDSVSPQAIGDRVQRVVREAVGKIEQSREEVAARQFGEIRRMVGDSPVVDYANTKKALQDIIGEYSDVVGADSRRIRTQAQRLLDEIGQRAGYSLDAARRARSSYGRASRGGEDVFSNVNRDVNRRIAARLYGAMSSDIEAAGTRLDEAAGFGANSVVPVGVTARKPSEMLKQANDDYRRHSDLLRAVEMSPLRRLLGDEINVDDFMTVNTLPPETVISRIGAMKPSELGQVRDFMQRNAPETWQQYKRMLIDDALSAAQTMPASAGARTLPYSAGGFIRSLGGDKPDKIERLRTIFDPGEMEQVTDALQAARRLGDKFGANFSGTGPYNEVVQALRNLTVTGVATTASSAAGFNKVAQLMTDSQGRRALIELSRLPPGTRKANDLAAYVASVIAVNAEPEAPPLEIDVVGGKPGAPISEEDLQRLRASRVSPTP